MHALCNITKGLLLELINLLIHGSLQWVQELGGSQLEMPLSINESFLNQTSDHKASASICKYAPKPSKMALSVRRHPAVPSVVEHAEIGRAHV